MSPLRREQPTVDALEHELADVLATSASAESERDRLAMVLDACRDGVVVVDADGNEVYRNPAAERYREARHADAVAAGNIASAARRSAAGHVVGARARALRTAAAMLELHAVPLATTTIASSAPRCSSTTCRRSIGSRACGVTSSPT